MINTSYNMFYKIMDLAQKEVYAFVNKQPKYSDYKVSVYLGWKSMHSFVWIFLHSSCILVIWLGATYRCVASTCMKYMKKTILKFMLKE